VSTARILVIEDETLVAEEISLRLRKMGHEASAIADNAHDAFEFARAVRPDLALVDIHIKGPLNGIEAARRLRRDFGIPVVFLTAHADAATLREASAVDPFGYVVKPFDSRALAATVEIALRRHGAEQKVERMERWLAATMNSIGDGVMATDSEFRVSFINPVAERLCGWPDGTALGRPAAEVFRLVGRNLSDVMAEAITEKFVVSLNEYQLESADGTRIPIDDTVAPIRDPSGKLGGVVIVFRDASARRQHEEELHSLNAELEDRVRKRTVQLEAANSELASFSYSIAHDLRAPLRAIIGFSTLAMQDHGNDLSRESQRLLEIVTSRAGQMARMIDDYLRLSGLSRVGLHYSRLDMTQLARKAWAEVIADVPAPPQLQLSELPVVNADEGLVRQVWFNLLSNAVKFSRTAPAPLVQITGAEERGNVHYSVRDNGVGFDPAQTPKLFRVFERLHTQTEYEGNGIGLCIVQRILHRHEGDVRIDAVPGAGAVVKFWLPTGGHPRASLTHSD
jgi:two-component system, cell cycle sensor histidine kinase and response regulator CckA